MEEEISPDGSRYSNLSRFEEFKLMDEPTVLYEMLIDSAEGIIGGKNEVRIGALLTKKWI
jgi:hypothetical protein